MSARKRGIIRGIMELWRLYRFVLYIKNHPKVEYSQLRSDYRTAAGLSEQVVADLWDTAIRDEFIYPDDGRHPHLLFKGKKLTEMYGYGFLAVAIKEYGGPIVLLAGIASIINLIVIILR